MLGKGGMGTVYRARDIRLRRPVAIKVLNQEITADPDRKKRFIQEAQAAAAISHPAIAQVYDVDEAEGATFIAMEFIEGQTVRQLVHEGSLDMQTIVEIAIQAAEGLSKAHDLGITHRDIKPDNIMVTRDGHVKILDFGLARLASPLGETSGKPEDRAAQMTTMALTQSGMLVGTLAYMSPEQIRGEPVDRRTDIFSVGATLYEMAAGERPFGGKGPIDTLHAIAFEEPRPLTEVRQNVPSGLQRIISKCLRKVVDDRYQDAQTLIRDLKELKREIDSGITRDLSFPEKIRDWLDALPSLKNQPTWLPAAALGLAALIILLLYRSGELWSAFFTVMIVWWVYQRLRSRARRLARRFAAKISLSPEVRLISFRNNRATVIVDQIVPKTYLHINSLIESADRKFHLGGPITAVVLDKVPDEELRRILQEPGVLYLRDKIG